MIKDKKKIGKWEITFLLTRTGAQIQRIYFEGKGNIKKYDKLILHSDQFFPRGENDFSEKQSISMYFVRFF